MANILLKNVSKKYKNSDKVVVNHIDMAIHDNEFLILVGPSGCGKTTILRMIAGLESITDGDIYIGDQRVNDLQPKDRQVSLVFQDYALYPHLNVYGNLAFGLKMQKRSKEEIDAKVKKIGKALELEDLLDRKPGELSGGQRQRVALGRALIRDTEVMLMDEPLSNLDAKLRVQTRSEILNLHKQIKRTVVFVTHDQVEAMTMGERIAVMNDGIIQQLDTPEKIYEKPANKFVAGFMGSPPMNFLNCDLVCEKKDIYAVCGDYSMKLPEKVLSNKVKQKVGDKVILGIRPEDTEIHKDMSIFHDYEAKVSIVEVLGLEQLITIQIEGQEYTARVDCSQSFSIGEKVGVVTKSDKIHIFDSESEENISLT
jgi:multiple sugar transport system ATP-binding protein